MSHNNNIPIQHGPPHTRRRLTNQPAQIITTLNNGQTLNTQNLNRTQPRTPTATLKKQQF
jgi:hypothetical protein